jgi:actin-related protein
MILEIDSTVMRVGYAEQFQPQHIIAIEPIQDANKSESQWYSILSPWVQQVYDRLMCNPTTRRVVILHKHYAPKAWLTALELILWNKGVPAVVCFSSLEMLPIAQGWKRGLIVQVSREEAVCVCHSDGHILPFTYQSVPCGYQQILPEETKISTEWTEPIDQLLLNENNPNSLVVALLKCLEACPRDIRLYVISNIVFCGDGMVLLPDLGRRVAKRLKEILEGNQSPLELGEAQDDALLTMVPIDIATLRPLADRLAVTSCAPHRPDWISYVGSSLWAAIWNKYDDEETRIKWTFAPTE